MSAYSISGRGKCLPLYFQGGANVLPLVLGRGKCAGEQMSGGGKCPTLATRRHVWSSDLALLESLLYRHESLCSDRRRGRPAAWPTAIFQFNYN